MDYSLSYLREKLNEAGISNNTGLGTIYYWIKTKRLTLRESPHNGYRLVNDKEVEEIIKAFKPGGKGEWHAKK